ncbi:hypothetical protein Godav_006030 [Gossypium davidsonii]|uniref:Aminotransferase-like plant mobile domain-containing protein n=1 Tax=Gossypium davidsonii TaxID=34287 RepID=A0A7J8S3B4_GOSDV|nr:hypothetical protein [Gossypium davidsonii]
MRSTFWKGPGNNYWIPDICELVKTKFCWALYRFERSPKEQHARAYILMIIRALLMPDKSQNLVYLRWLLKIVGFREANELSGWSVVLASCSNSTIQEYIPFEFLVNPNIWHVKVSLVVFAMVEMHESDRNNRYEFLPTCKTIIAPKLACDLEYMPWFRVHGKSYLLAEEARAAVEASPLSTPMQEPTPMAAPPPSQYGLTYSGFICGSSSPTYCTLMPSTFQTMTHPTMMYNPLMFGASTESLIVLPSVYGTQYSYTPTPMVSQTLPRSLFYQGGTSLQPSISRMEDTR